MSSGLHLSPSSGRVLRGPVGLTRPCGYLPTEADMFRMSNPGHDRATIDIILAVV